MALPAGAPAWYYGALGENLTGISEGNMKKELIRAGSATAEPGYAMNLKEC